MDTIDEVGKEAVQESQPDLYLSTDFFARRFALTHRWILRFGKKQGLPCRVEHREYPWPVERMLSLLSAMEPARLGRLQANANAHANPVVRKRERVPPPEGYETVRESWESRFPNIPLESVLRSLTHSAVNRTKIPGKKALVYKVDEAIDHMNAYSEKLKKRENIVQHVWKKEPRIVPVGTLKPLLELPPLEAFKEVAKEFREKQNLFFGVDHG
jgi:hypothetical protein